MSNTIPLFCVTKPIDAINVMRFILFFSTDPLYGTSFFSTVCVLRQKKSLATTPIIYVTDVWRIFIRYEMTIFSMNIFYVMQAFDMIAFHCMACICASTVVVRWFWGGELLPKMWSGLVGPRGDGTVLAARKASHSWGGYNGES